MIYSVPSYIHKMIRQRREEDITHISWGRSNRHIFFGDVFAGIALNLKKLAYFVKSQSISIRRDDRKQLQCLIVVLNNKTGPLFMNSIEP